MPRRRVRLATRRSRSNTSASSRAASATRRRPVMAAMASTRSRPTTRATRRRPRAARRRRTLLDTTAPSSTASSPGDQPDELQRVLHRDRPGRLRAGAGGAVCPGAGSDWLHEGRDEHAAARARAASAIPRRPVMAATASTRSRPTTRATRRRPRPARRRPRCSTRRRRRQRRARRRYQPDDLQRLLHGG